MKVEKFSIEVSANKILGRIHQLLEEGTPVPLKREWVINGFSNLWIKRHSERINFEGGFDYLFKQGLILNEQDGILLNPRLVVKEKEGIKLNGSFNKIFISHATADKEYVREIIRALKEIGISNNEIYCSSFEGYGVPADGDILEWIKEGLSSDVLVLFILSNTYFTRPICLCEMGATWVQAKKYIPILIPPLEYNQIQGVIPLSKKAYKINESTMLNSVKKTIEEYFNLEPIDYNIWDDFVKEYCSNIDTLIKRDLEESQR